MARPPLAGMPRAIGSEEEHDQFRASIRAFFEKEALPYLDDWERAGIVDRRLFEQANGFLGTDAPQELGSVIDARVQLHGGYGYMTEHSIAKADADARITRIDGGTTEIMKEIIGRSLGV